MMTIVVNAEEKFDVSIPDDEVKNLKTVGDAVSFIANEPGLSQLVRPLPLATRAQWADLEHTSSHDPAHKELQDP